jgi:DNA-binding CsgD family transcriptional regulator
VLPDGRVLSIHAAETIRDRSSVAVIVDRARPAEVSALLVDAYGLTHRQRDVLGRLLLGRPMTQLAHSLGISEHTAQDHRKAIYRQMGVSSRSELAALLQFEQYDPRVWGDIPPSPYGGFLESGPSKA